MYQNLIIVGNLGGDPTMRYTPSGQAVTMFNVATSRSYTANGAKVQEKCWFRVTVWGKTAESCNQYLHKGSKILVEGRLVPDQATGGPKVYTRQDGTTGASYDVTANTVRFMGSKADAEPTDEADTDSIPF